jgi:hypothetical protein
MTTRTRTARTFAQAARSLAPRLSLAAATIALVAACDQDRTVTDPAANLSKGGPQQGTFYGAAVKVGNGIGRSYFSVEGGVLREVGVALSEAALQGLPGSEGHNGHHAAGNPHRHENEYVLPMHPQNPTPFQHVGLNWMAEGHPPVYQVPHFDVHFYMISLAERNAMTPADPQWIQKARNLPAPEFIPERYVSTHVLAGVEPEEETFPRMGMHWVDIASPEFGGAPFDATFIYGSFDGKIIFGEPMVAYDLLASKPNLERELPRAQRGYNAGKYRVYWNENTKEYRIAMADFAGQ